MPKETQWIPPARLREIEQGRLPHDADEHEEQAIAEAVARILGNKPADQQVAEPESEPELSKSEQRRQDRKAAERAKRFGRG